MPKFTLSVPFEKMHGAIKDLIGGSGLVAYYTSRGGNIARKYVVPLNPNSTLQQSIRTTHAANAAGYKALTAVNAAAWVEAANQINRTNILNLTYTLTGIGLYCMINDYRTMNGQAAVSTPPTITSPVPVAGLTSATYNAGDLDLVIDTTGMPSGQFMFVRISRDLGGAARQGRVNDVRCVSSGFSGSFIDASGTSSTSFSLSLDNFTVAQGDNIAVALQPLSSAYYPGVQFLEKNIEVA